MIKKSDPLEEKVTSKISEGRYLREVIWKRRGSFSCSYCFTELTHKVIGPQVHLGPGSARKQYLKITPLRKEKRQKCKTDQSSPRSRRRLFNLRQSVSWVRTRLTQRISVARSRWKPQTSWDGCFAKWQHTLIRKNGLVNFCEKLTNGCYLRAKKGTQRFHTTYTTRMRELSQIRSLEVEKSSKLFLTKSASKFSARGDKKVIGSKTLHRSQQLVSRYKTTVLLPSVGIKKKIEERISES